MIKNFSPNIIQKGSIPPKINLIEKTLNHRAKKMKRLKIFWRESGLLPFNLSTT